MAESLQEVAVEEIWDDQRLQNLVEKISLEDFGQAFNHQATFNYRLRTTGGRYHLESHNLDFNPKVYQKYGEEELINVIKHELCHYHLHLAGRGYQHRDAEFKKLLKETGGSRFVRPLEDQTVRNLHHYSCQVCKQVYLRRRRINTKKFGCRCGGKLTKKKADF